MLSPWRSGVVQVRGAAETILGPNEQLKTSGQWRSTPHSVPARLSSGTPSVMTVALASPTAWPTVWHPPHSVCWCMAPLFTALTAPHPSRVWPTTGASGSPSAGAAGAPPTWTRHSNAPPPDGTATDPGASFNARASLWGGTPTPTAARCGVPGRWCSASIGSTRPTIEAVPLALRTRHTVEYAKVTVRPQR